MTKRERWLVYPALMAMLLLLLVDRVPMGAASADARDAEFGRIICRQFAVVDARKRVVAEITSTRGVGFIVVNDDKGKPSAVLAGRVGEGANAAGGGLTFHDGSITAIRSTFSGSGLHLLNRDGKSTAAAIDADDEGGAMLRLCDRKGEPRIFAAVPRGEGASLTVRGTGEVAAVTIACPGKEAAIRLGGAAGTIQASTLNGGGAIVIGTDKERPGVTLRCEGNDAVMGIAGSLHGVSLGTDRLGGFVSVKSARSPTGKLETRVSLQSSVAGGKVEVKSKDGKTAVLEP